MGFYSPSLLIQDARRHGVVVLLPEANASDWGCDRGSSEGTAGRLGTWGEKPRYRQYGRQFGSGYYSGYGSGSYYSESWSLGRRSVSWGRNYSGPEFQYYESGGAEWSAPSYRPRW